MSSQPAPPPALSEDDLDDLLYASRAGELAEITSTLSSLSTTHSVPQSTILLAAIDSDSKNTPLHYAAANGHLPIVQHLLSLLPPTASDDDSASARKKILDPQNSSGNTPLHWAALNGHLEIVKTLVKDGADPGVKNAVGRSAVVEAEIAGGEKAEECVTWLLGNWGGVEEGVGGAKEGGEDGVNGDAEGVNGVDGESADGKTGP